MHARFPTRLNSDRKWSKAKAHGLAVGLFGASIASLSVATAPARAQSFARLPLDTWRPNELAQTYDHIIVEPAGNVNSAPEDANSSGVFWWDSYGRVRFNRKDDGGPFVAYRFLAIDAGTDSRFIRSTMDDFELALGAHLGDWAGWNWSTVLGIGYSSTQPFVNSSGIFGIGHILAERPLSPNDSLVLSVDYEGNSSLLPDVPLPGFAWRHRTDDNTLYTMLGYPMSKVVWKPTPPLEITAMYTVPYTADVDVEYRVHPHFGLYADAANFFQGFVTARSNGQPSGDVTNRQFYQMRRVEAGVRIIFDPWVDAGIGVGYAFDQGFSTGYDVTNLQPIGHISNEPYLSIVLRGTF